MGESLWQIRAIPGQHAAGARLAMDGEASSAASVDSALSPKAESPREETHDAPRVVADRCSASGKVPVGGSPRK